MLATHDAGGCGDIRDIRRRSKVLKYRTKFIILQLNNMQSMSKLRVGKVAMLIDMPD